MSVVGARVAIEGASVCRSGSTTGWHCGTIQQRDASITYPQGTVFELIRTNVCAEPGDSGGSFISVDQAQGVTSGGSGNCRQGGTTYFQPVNEILTAYGLSLRDHRGTPAAAEPGHLHRPAEYRHRHPEQRTERLPAEQPELPDDRHRLHSGCLDTNERVDFDLFLERWNGRSWGTVAISDVRTPTRGSTTTARPATTVTGWSPRAAQVPTP